MLLSSQDRTVDFFVAFSPDCTTSHLRTMTDEEVDIFDANEAVLLAIHHEGIVVPNIGWIIPMALFGSRGRFCFVKE